MTTSPEQLPSPPTLQREQTYKYRYVYDDTRARDDKEEEDLPDSFDDIQLSQPKWWRGECPPPSPMSQRDNDADDTDVDEEEEETKEDRELVDYSTSSTESPPSSGYDSDKENKPPVLDDAEAERSRFTVRPCTHCQNNPQAFVGGVPASMSSPTICRQCHAFQKVKRERRVRFAPFVHRRRRRRPPAVPLFQSTTSSSRKGENGYAKRKDQVPENESQANH